MGTALKLVTPPRLPHPTPTMNPAARQLGDLVMNPLSSCIPSVLVLVLLSEWPRIASYIHAGLCRRSGRMSARLEKGKHSPDAVTGELADCKLKRDVGLKVRNRKRQKESMLMVQEAR